MFEAMTNQFMQWRDAAHAKIQSFGQPTDFFITIGLYGLAGFIAGITFKHAGKFLIFATLVTIGVLYGLQQFGIISIHQTAFLNLLGLTEPVNFQTIWQSITSWVQSHVPQSIAIGVGLILAWIFG